MIDLSVITSTCRPKDFRRFIAQMKSQSYKGINVEHIIIQESDNHTEFYSPDLINCIIRRQPISHDYGAAAKDLGLSIARGQYCCFFDDDNIYYSHAIATLFTTVAGHDVGICRTHYKEQVIPIDDAIVANYIDTMCFAVRTDLGRNVAWAGGGRFSDFRYIDTIKKLTCDVNYNKLIIGEHL